MSCFKQSYNGSIEAFKLIGSQISPTPRSDKQVSAVCHKNYRPCSADPCHSSQTEDKIKCTRPKSAEYTFLKPCHSKPLQSPCSPSRNSCSGVSSLKVSHFTDLSTKLLQNLLDNSSHKMFETDCKYSFAENSSKISTANKPETVKVEKYVEIASNNEFFNSDFNLKLQKNAPNDSRSFVNNDIDLENFTVLSEPDEVAEEKRTEFLEWHPFDFHAEKKSYHKNMNAYNKCKNNLIQCNPNTFSKTYLNKEVQLFFQETHTCQQNSEVSEKAALIELEGQNMNSEIRSESDIIKSGYIDNENEFFKSTEKNKKICQRDWEKSSEENDNSKLENTALELTHTLKSSSQSNMQTENIRAENSFNENLKTTKQIFCEEAQKERKLDMNKEDLKGNCVHHKIDVNDSTYEEIVQLLETLDEEDSESLNLADREDEATATSELGAPVSDKIDYLNAVSSYLEEIEMENDKFDLTLDFKESWNPENIHSPKLEELLNKNSVELAHEVFSLKIQIEDQKKGIKLLRDTLTELKEANKAGELEHQESLHKVTSEAEALVQRHQKFIKQLLNEKKNLNETVSKLVEDLKSEEEKYKKNIKAMEEKHSIEIKRAKEAQAVADKIKREKWMENKTKKIKEMTVKGLEPELSRMAARQQEEMTELRNLHKAELEAVELRAARRNSELMDELRAELTKEKERAIAKETASLRAMMEKEFEEEKNKLQKSCQILKERIRKQEERLSNQELEFQQRLVDYKQEEERNKQKIIWQHQENLEEIRRQHLVEMKSLKDSEEADKQVLLNNYKKELAANFLEREVELHQEYKKERDKEIEMVIEALEKESTQIQLELNTANEGRLKRLKDKMDAEIKELEASEVALKIKLSEVKSKLSEKEDFITELNSKIRQLQTELTFSKKSCEEMSLEKAKLKEVIREEFKNNISDLINEKESLEKNITFLKELHAKELTKKDQLILQVKCEMQKELTRLYSRIKKAVNKREKIIESLREENGAANQKCRQLEYLLDQQRRNLLLQ